MVDDAIVMLENIVRHIEGGMRPFEAALKGAREIGFTIVSITFSLIAVFIPVLLMGGMVGRVFREFAVTIAVAIIVSGFVSLTLTPMLCARMLRAHQREREGRTFVLRGFEAMFQAGCAATSGRSTRCWRTSRSCWPSRFATLVATVWLYLIIPKGFFPTEDTGFIAATTEARPTFRSRRWSSVSARSPRSCARTRRSTMSIRPSASAARTRRPTTGAVHRAEAARGARDASTAVIQRLRPTANADVTGMIVYFQTSRTSTSPAASPRANISTRCRSSDTETLYRVAPELRDKIAGSTALRDVTTDLYIKNPQMTVEIDREKAARLRHHRRPDPPGAVYNAFGTRQVATIFTPSNDYQVHPGEPAEFQRGSSPTLAECCACQGAPGGRSVPLGRRVRARCSADGRSAAGQPPGPAAGGDDLVQPRARRFARRRRSMRSSRSSAKPACRRTIATGFQGTAQVFQESLKGQGVLVLAAIFAAYVVLGILYESFIHPITIISGLPSAGIGALLTLMLFNMDLSVIAMIGIVMLVGIVKKNAIMMIDFAIERRRVGLVAEAAIREAALLRFRPIMMTTFAAIFGTLPIALGTGAGAELRQPLGVAVVGGLMRVAIADALHHAGGLPLSRPRRPHAQAPSRAAARRGAGAERPRAVAAE